MILSINVTQNIREPFARFRIDGVDTGSERSKRLPLTAGFALTPLYRLAVNGVLIADVEDAGALLVAAGSGPHRNLCLVRGVSDLTATNGSFDFPFQIFDPITTKGASLALGGCDAVPPSFPVRIHARLGALAGPLAAAVWHRIATAAPGRKIAKFAGLADNILRAAGRKERYFPIARAASLDVGIYCLRK